MWNWNGNWMIIDGIEKKLKYNMNRIYAVASHSIRILNAGEMSCWNLHMSSQADIFVYFLTSSHGGRSFCLLSKLSMKTTSYSRQTSPHISYVHIHTPLYKMKIVI